MYIRNVDFTSTLSRISVLRAKLQELARNVWAIVREKRQLVTFSGRPIAVPSGRIQGGWIGWLATPPLFKVI